MRSAIREFFHGNRFYENLGDGTFREISTAAGSANSLWAWSSVWLDFDNDGRKDVYVVNGFVSGEEKEDM